MKLTANKRRKFRVRKKIKQVANNERFRLTISRSSKNISAQIIDDKKNITLLSASSVEKDFKSGGKITKIEVSKIVAEKLARYSIISRLPLEKFSNSNTPSGPFQIIRWLLNKTLLNFFTVSDPISKPM